MVLLMTQTDVIKYITIGWEPWIEQDVFSLINAPLQAGREPLQKINSNSVIWTYRVSFCQIEWSNLVFRFNSVNIDQYCHQH